MFVRWCEILNLPSGSEELTVRITYTEKVDRLFLLTVLCIIFRDNLQSRLQSNNSNKYHFADQCLNLLLVYKYIITFTSIIIKLIFIAGIYHPR